MKKEPSKDLLEIHKEMRVRVAKALESIVDMAEATGVPTTRATVMGNLVLEANRMLDEAEED